MAKTDTPYSEIDLSKADKQIRKPNWLENKDIVALDTETKDGDIFMLSVSMPDYGDYVVENDGKPLTGERLFNELTKSRFRSNCNVFFNLKFDASVLLKVLPERNCHELRLKNETEFRDYTISYIPGKFLSIKDANENIYEYYDVAQIFGDSLEGAIEGWLDNSEQKNQQDIDVERFGDRDYLQENYRKITEYAKDDARQTRQVSEKLFHEAEENQNIPCGRPYSTGYLASQYLAQRLDHGIGTGPDFMRKQAYNAYTGGRFEVFERGDVGEIVGPDINSAYPANMANLPDPSSLEWKSSSVNDISVQDIKEADYGFVKATVSTDSSKRIQPFAVKIKGTQTYPTLDSVEITTLKEIFIFALENDYLTDFEIEQAVIGNETKFTRYPFDFMEDKYTERKQLEDNENYNAANTIKIYLNSLYGKTIQTNWNISKFDEQIEGDKLPEGENLKVDRASGISYTESLECGSFFNPFIAAYTTGLTRLQLHETVESLGLVDDTVMFATDCIMVDKEAFEQSNFQKRLGNDNNSYAEQLGKWDFDYEGEAFVIGCGIYQVDRANGKQKTVSRGFKGLEDMDMVKEAKQAKDYIEIANKRPRGFNEAIHGGDLDIADIGQFVKTTKKLYPDFDEGREWGRENITFDKLLQDSENSSPIVYSN